VENYEHFLKESINIKQTTDFQFGDPITTGARGNYLQWCRS